jgi:hypothetical protein
MSPAQRTPDPNGINRLKLRRALRLLSVPGARLVTEGDQHVLRPAEGVKLRAPLRLNFAEFYELARSHGLSPAGADAYRLSRIPASPSEASDAPPQPPPRRMPDAISWLASRKDPQGRPWLATWHREAAERLGNDYEAASRSGRLTMDWTRSARSGAPVPGGYEPQVLALSARKRVVLALEAVGPSLGPVLERICLEGLSLGETERLLRLPPREARYRLVDGLTRLAEHYGLIWR